MDTMETMELILDVQSLLKRFGVNQAEFSEQTGLTKQTVSNLVRGASGIRMATLSKICAAYNLDPGDVIRWSHVS